MAAAGAVAGTGVNAAKANSSEVLLHPELLSRDFILLTLQEKNIPVDSGSSSDKDSLTNLYLQHIIPLPRRELPNSRWGKKMEKKREKQPASNTQRNSCVADGSRKRPLIVFDGSSTSTTIKIKKTELGESNRLKPPPSGNLTNTIRRLSSPLSCSSPSVQSNSTIHRDGELDKNVVPNNQNLSGNCKSPPATVGTGCVKLKRAAPKDGESDVAGEIKSLEPKKRIQHVTWP
ncbi:ashwin [Polypterus senegalus]|nr:ashwin [Polypterus senegalus]